MTATAINTWFDIAPPSPWKRTALLSTHLPTSSGTSLERYLPTIQRRCLSSSPAEFKVEVLGRGGAGELYRQTPGHLLPAGDRGYYLRPLCGRLLQQICPRGSPGGGGTPAQL